LIELRPLTQLTLTDLQRVGSGYISDSTYTVTRIEADNGVTFDLQRVQLQEPYSQHYAYETEAVRRYGEICTMGYSFGAYADDALVGVIIAEALPWNRSLSVREFHVAETYRRRGIGGELMARVVSKARETGFRIIMCETQNTNAPAIAVYQRLGFHIEGIDISYYTNHDYPAGEIAIFMKRRLE
jgi:ribosomal protein S18 acetylase RimI-like enzyme